MKIVDLTRKTKSEISVVEAQYLDGLRLSLKFNDGRRQVIDLAGFLESARNPNLRHFLQKRFFKQFRVLNGNVVWKDYDMIFPVADLYQGKIS